MNKFKFGYNIGIKISIMGLVLSVLIVIVGGPTFTHIILVKSAAIGTYLLFLMLIIKSIYFIMKQQKLTNNRIYRFLRKNNMYQREQGLIVFNIIFIHIVMTTLMMVSDLDTLIYYYLTALIPTLVLLYLEFTSFRCFQKLISSWKKHHSVIWLTVPLIYLHVVLLSSASFKYLGLGLIVLFTAIIEKRVGLKRGNKHLTYLTIGLIIGVIQFVITVYHNHQVEEYVPMTVETSSQVVVDDTASNGSEALNVNSEEVTTYIDGVYTGSGTGHVGEIIVQTTIENDQIVSIDVISENEDGKWWEPVINSIPDQIIANNSAEEIDGVAGSTHSSDGLIEAVQNSLDQAYA